MENGEKIYMKSLSGKRHTPGRKILYRQDEEVSGVWEVQESSNVFFLDASCVVQINQIFQKKIPCDFNFTQSPLDFWNIFLIAAKGKWEVKRSAITISVRSLLQPFQTLNVNWILQFNSSDLCSLLIRDAINMWSQIRARGSCIDSVRSNK